MFITLIIKNLKVYAGLMMFFLKQLICSSSSPKASKLQVMHPNIQSSKLRVLIFGSTFSLTQLRAHLPV